VRRGQGGAEVGDPWGLMGGSVCPPFRPYDFLVSKDPHDFLIAEVTHWSRVFIAESVGFCASYQRWHCTHPTTLWSPHMLIAAGGAPYGFEGGLQTMMQRPKRGYTARAITLIGTVLVHALIIYVILTNATKVFTSIPTQATITIFSEPRRRPVDWNLPPVKLLRRSAVLPKKMLVPPTVDIPAESPLRDEYSSSPTQPSEVPGGVSKEDAVVPNAPGASVGLSDRTPTIRATHRVQPSYPSASASAGEQGYVVLGVLVDERGAVSEVELVQSSGYRELDEAALHAIRQWTFAVEAKMPQANPTWTKIAFGFRAYPSDLAGTEVTVIPFDAAVAEQIQAVASPINQQPTSKPRAAAGLRRIILSLQASKSSSVRKFEESIPPIQLLAMWGKVQSIDFLGIASHGLDMDENNHLPETQNAHESMLMQWELYRVTQQGGVSEWLVDVNRHGVIKVAQGITCTVPCP
jgi:TonB family protein